MAVFAKEYTFLESGAFLGVKTDNPSIGVFLGQVFNWGIAVAIVLALIMVIWGGIEKMTSDSWKSTDAAKTKFENAGWGLALALASYLILYTVNPCLVNWGKKDGCDNTFLNPPEELYNALVSATTNTSITTESLPLGGVKNYSENPELMLGDAKTRKQLQGAGIRINKPNCPPIPPETRCTSLDGLPQKAVVALITANKGCVRSIAQRNCIVVTGGTEGGHATHKPGRDIVDIGYDENALKQLKFNNELKLTEYDYKKNGNLSNNVPGVFVCETNATKNEKAYFVPCNANVEKHIHIQF
ncbi:MAG: pilin [bacterium]